MCTSGTYLRQVTYLPHHREYKAGNVALIEDLRLRPNFSHVYRV